MLVIQQSVSQCHTHNSMAVISYLVTLVLVFQGCLGNTYERRSYEWDDDTFEPTAQNCWERCFQVLLQKSKFKTRLKILTVPNCEPYSSLLHFVAKLGGPGLGGATRRLGGGEGD
jgi:hypothetical protein